MGPLRSALTWFRSSWMALIVVLVYALLLFPLGGLGGPSFTALKARDGVLDGTALNQSIHSLGGTWTVYSGVLADPVLAATGSESLPAPLSLEVPSALKRSVATYHLRVGGLVPGRSYGLYFSEVASAYRLFVDGVEVASRGVPDPVPTGYRAEVRPLATRFQARAEAADLVIQVADHTSSLGGLWQEVLMGPEPLIEGYQAREEAIDLFFLGGIWMMAVFLWILALILRRDRATFYLALFSGAILVKCLYSRTMYGFVWFPFLGYEAAMALAYLSVAALPPVFLAFAHRCFPREIWRPAVRIAIVPSLAEIVLVLVTPFRYYQAHFLWFQVVILVAGILTLVGTLRAVRHRREGALLFLIGFVMVFAAGINDILFANQIVHTGYLLNLGLYGFLLSQAALIAVRYRQALVGAEERRTFEQWAKEDTLTGLVNRRRIDEVLDLEFSAFQRYGQVFSVLMIDLDWFKQVNDSHGHLLGDSLLVQVASLLQSRLRKTDLCGRFGGEEFLVVLRHTRADEARQVAETLRQAVEASLFPTGGVRLRATISVGAAEATADLTTVQALVDRADKALYQAKNQGRNRVVLADSRPQGLSF